MTWSLVPAQADGDVWTIQLWRQIQENLNAGVMRPLANVTVGGGGAANIDFTAIPGTFKALVVVLHARGDAAATGVAVGLRFNGDTGTNYDSQRHYATATTVGNDEFLAQTSGNLIGVPASTAPASTFGPATIIIPAYAVAGLRRAALYANQYKGANSSGNMPSGGGAVFWRNTAAITQVTLIPASGNFVQDSRATLLAVN